jgi:Terminase RNaseH-like domain
MSNSDLNIPLHLRKLHPAQERFVNSPHKRKINRSGRRGGKTIGAAALAANRFLDGQRVLYAAPVADQCESFWREVCRIFGEAIALGVLRKNESERFIERPGTTTRIRAKTAWNADTLRGDFADLLILDEFQLMDELAWAEVGAPMLADNNGHAVFIYTPASLRSRSVSKARDKMHAAKMFERAQNDPRWLAIHWTSIDNPYISREALNELSLDMTALAYRQEILAQDIDEIPGALWTRQTIEKTRVHSIENIVLNRIVVGVDPSGSATTEAGIVAVGRSNEGHIYIMCDASRRAASPLQWAQAAVERFHLLKADVIIAETNFGGAMVRELLRQVDDRVPVKETFSSRGKIVRAQSLSARFEDGTAHIVGELPELEDEMCSFVEGGKSPNRLDACVFAANDIIDSPSGLITWMGQKAKALLSETGSKNYPKPMTRTFTGPGIVTEKPMYGPPSPEPEKKSEPTKSEEEKRIRENQELTQKEFDRVLRGRR